MAFLNLAGLLGGREQGGSQMNTDRGPLGSDRNDPNQPFDDEQVRISMLNQASEESQFYLVVVDPILRAKVLLNPTNNSLDEVSARYTMEEAKPVQVLMESFVHL